ncbi:MAG: hypothetical protein IMZ64_07485 [Bacteroidetes bacterium]|nr:hypothetical protein [Bacteroidota bacterium]
MAKSANKLENPSDGVYSASSLIPSLPSSSLAKFLSLCGGERAAFNHLYHRLWAHLWPIKQVEALSFGYAVNPVADDLGLIPGQVWLLSRLWVLSGGGVRAVNSMHHSFTNHEKHLISKFMKSGHIVRTSFDPALPDAVKPAYIQRTYISLTPSGVFLFKSVVRKIDKYIQSDVLGSF